MIPSIINNQTLPVNSECHEDEFVVDQSDPCFKYTIVPNDLIRDKNISPNCRWLIMYLSSNDPSWSVKISQVIKHAKGFLGRDKIYKLVKEAMDAGYINREERLIKADKGYQRRYVYKVAKSPIFKKSLLLPGFQDPDVQHPDDQHTSELLSKEILSKEEDNSLKVLSAKDAIAEVELKKSSEVEKPKREKPEFSAKVREVANELINSLSRIKATYVPPKNMTAVLTEVDFILRLDKREVQDVLDVFNWAVSDSFWCDKMFKPNPAKYLREKFDQLEMKMKAKPKPDDKPYSRRGFAPCSDDADAIAIAKDMTRRAL